MRVLHTSDWHLGRLLYGKKRHHEFESFLQWLLLQINSLQVEVLLIAGDIFDTNTPGNRAQQMYYRFLADIAQTQCRHVVVIGGNHDSPSFLDAPGQILRALNVHVVGEACENPADEVIQLTSGDKLEMLVCAVPYLRERDLRRVNEYETAEDKDSGLLSAVKAHYKATAEYAEGVRGAADIPIIGMGHLFTTGGQLQEDDGVRELYVGSLGQVPVGTFPDNFNYVALGHLHVPQLVGGHQHIRYCGSPVAMGFAEAGQQKQVILIDFKGSEPEIKTINIPVFQKKERLRGDISTLTPQLNSLVTSGDDIWLEIEYTGHGQAQDLRQQLAELVEGSSVSILRVRNRALRVQLLNEDEEGTTLADLSLHDVFEKRMNASGIEPENKDELRALHQELVNQLHEDDIHADT